MVSRLLALTWFWIGCGSCALALKCPAPVNNPQQWNVKPEITSSKWNEVSGLAASNKNSHNGLDVVYVNNDNTNDGRIGVINAKTGQTVLIIDIQPTLKSMGKYTREPEDLAIGPCSPNDRRDCIYVGGFGDNGARGSDNGKTKKTYEIYKFPEPDIGKISTSTWSPSKSELTIIPFRWRYPQFSGENGGIGIHSSDCESMFVDPVDASIYIVPKWPGSRDKYNSVHRIPGGTPHNVRQDANPIATNGWLTTSGEWMTRADISGDGQVITIGSDRRASFWIRNSPTEPLSKTLAREPCSFKSRLPPRGGQHEALTFMRRSAVQGKLTLFECSEGSTPDLQSTEFFIGATNPVPSPTPFPTRLPTPATPTFTPTLNVRAEEDAEESHQGGVYVDSSDLELGYDGHNDARNQLVCMRFSGVNIAPGAQVTNANIAFVSKETIDGTSPVLECFGERSTNAGSISSASNSLSSRSFTNAKVTWQNMGTWNAGSTYRSPDLKSVVQEIVNLNGWRANNAMLLCCRKRAGDNSQTKRNAYSTNWGSNKSPILSLTVGNGAPVSSPVALPASFGKVRAKQDAEESYQGGVYVASSDLELGYDGHNDARNQLVCMRFSGVNIAPGAQITNADIAFMSKEKIDGASPVLECFGERSANAGSITTASKGLSSRSFTNAKVTWRNMGTWNAGSTYQSPDLKSVVQEIVNLDGWRANNAMLLCCRKRAGDNSQTKRNAYSAEWGSGDKAPLFRFGFVGGVGRSANDSEDGDTGFDATGMAIIGGGVALLMFAAVGVVAFSRKNRSATTTTTTSKMSHNPRHRRNNHNKAKQYRMRPHV